MENIITASEESLWKSAAAGDIEAEEQLIQKYSVLVRACARPYFLTGGDSEDLIQEGMLGLLSAVRHFEPLRDTSFKTYAERCIKSRLYTAIKSASRFKHRPLNDSISFESPQFDERQTLSATYLCDPEELVITQELTDELRAKFTDTLSRLEKEILEYYLDGLSYSDIALKAGRTVKSVDNAVQRIRKKLSQLI
ncbi:MAG: sigma-70 family RNA polymerase sigma factor [Oscillospiraceae bacterium]